MAVLAEFDYNFFNGGFSYLENFEFNVICKDEFFSNNLKGFRLTGKADITINII